MNKYILLLLISLTLYPKIVVIKWNDSQFSKDIESGVRSVLIPDDIHNLKKNKGKAGTLFRDYSDAKNTVLIVIGEKAIKLSARWVKKTPVIYCGIIDKSMVKGKTNFTGIDLIPNISKQISYIKQVLPGVKKIGIIFNASKSFTLVEKIEAKAKNYGIKVEKITINQASDVGTALHFLKGIDAILLIPDPVILNPTVLKLIILNEFKTKMPVVGFLPHHISGGVVFGYVVDLASIGKKAAVMAKSIIDGNKSVAEIHPSHPEGYFFINLKTANKIGINVNENLIKKAKEVVK